MTTIADPPSSKRSNDFHPDSIRMTIGEHLDELRGRLIFALAGLAIATVVCLFFGERVVGIFVKPLIDVLMKKNLNPQLFYTEISDGFMVYMKISLICAIVISAPWIAYHLWQFIAAGLYPHERKYITRYIPLSILLLILGMCFVYFLVLPWTISFFVTFGDSIPLPRTTIAHVATTMPPAGLPIAPMLDGDPASPTPGQFWINTAEGRLKLFFNASDIRVIPFGPSNLLAPHISLPEYIDLVIGSLLMFGLCFQMPLFVLALVKIGILEIQTLRKSRKYVIFVMSILAAAITPGDLVTAMLALMVPLVLLYEFGIVLAVWSTKRAAASASAEI